MANPNWQTMTPHHSSFLASRAAVWEHRQPDMSALRVMHPQQPHSRCSKAAAQCRLSPGPNLKFLTCSVNLLQPPHVKQIQGRVERSTQLESKDGRAWHAQSKSLPRTAGII